MGRLSLMCEHVEVHVRHVTQAELEALEDMPVAIMYPLDDEGVATHNAAPVLNAGEQCELPAEVVAGLPADIVAALQGVQAAYNALPESDHGSFRAEIQKFIDAAIKQLCMPGGGAKPKRPDAYRFLDEKRAGRRRPARVAAYHAMDALLALGWPSARRPPPVASMPVQAQHAAEGTPSQPVFEVALEVAKAVVFNPGWTPEEDAPSMMDAHCVAVAVEEAPDAAALGSSSVMSTVPASLDDEISPSRKKARLSSDPYSEGSEGATREAISSNATPTPRLQPQLQPMPEAGGPASAACATTTSAPEASDDGREPQVAHL